jgi:hypothetical protein
VTVYRLVREDEAADDLLRIEDFIIEHHVAPRRGPALADVARPGA